MYEISCSCSKNQNESKTLSLFWIDILQRTSTLVSKFLSKVSLIVTIKLMWFSNYSRVSIFMFACPQLGTLETVDNLTSSCMLTNLSCLVLSCVLIGRTLYRAVRQCRIGRTGFFFFFFFFFFPYACERPVSRVLNVLKFPASATIDGSWFQSLMDANIVYVQSGDAV